jgi:2-polyprenyl-3-methyl-5-hydroxy-6-metoxy-1,4-benzoquinol methylase
LELACGTGRITIPVAERGLDIMGIDISRKMIDQAKSKARKKNLNIYFSVKDMRQFSFDKKFSVIFIRCVLSDQIVKALINIIAPGIFK